MTDPRRLYQKLHKDDAAQLAVVINEGWFQRACVFARDNMAQSCDKAHLDGARQFADELERLTIEPKESGPLPDKSELKTFA